jgi:hypothetical protein
VKVGFYGNAQPYKWLSDFWVLRYLGRKDDAAFLCLIFIKKSKLKLISNKNKHPHSAQRHFIGEFVA